MRGADLGRGGPASNPPRGEVGKGGKAAFHSTDSLHDPSSRAYWSLGVAWHPIHGQLWVESARSGGNR